MRRREFTAALSVPLLPAVAEAGLSEGDAAAGVRAALERGEISASRYRIYSELWSELS